jgi:hypothetical protein
LDNGVTAMGNSTIELSGTEWTKQLLEYLGGERDEPPPAFPVLLSNWWFWGLWWGVLSILIFLFCGQSSKFIYIDF